ncbi:hypothetical protein BD309DRAFT_975627 [Dichomitus squalens]|nr:hypothetical protein BD309DRAFT_975627 [Dichomitus squalens]
MHRLIDGGVHMQDLHCAFTGTGIWMFVIYGQWAHVILARQYAYGSQVGLSR